MRGGGATITTGSALLVLFFAIPYFPPSVLMAADLFVVRFFILVGLLALVGISPVLAVLGLIVVARLFIERNNLKIQQLKSAMSLSSDNSPVFHKAEQGLDGGSLVAPNIPAQPEFEAPTSSVLRFAPSTDTGDNEFHPVAPSQDTKDPLPTASANGSDKVIGQLFKWVHPQAAQNL